MTLYEFVKQYFDVPNVGDTPQNLGQCVGLIEVWTDSLNLPHTWGNAKDLLADADKNSFDVILNTPNNFPLPGDIMVWGSAWGGGVGHTGVIIAGDANVFCTFEQNNPTGHAPQLITHVYDNAPNGTLGWLHPKGVIIDEQAIIDDLRTARDKNSQLYEADEATIANLNNLTKAKDSQISTLQQQVTDLTTQGQSKDMTIQTLQDQANKVPDLTKNLAQAENDRQLCLTAQTAQNQKISNLEKQISDGKPKGFWNKLLFIFS